MDNIKYVINYIYDLSTNTVLNFGSVSFSIFEMWVGFFAISITSDLFNSPNGNSTFSSCFFDTCERK